MSPSWYALHVKPNKERVVHDNLAGQQLPVFYPRLRVKPVNPRSRRERPFFAGYIFVEIDLHEAGHNALRWVEGAHGLVAFGDEPTAVPAAFIRDLRHRLKAIDDVGGLLFESLHAGDRVYITDGKFAGYEAIFDRRLSDRDRVQVFLSYLRNHPLKLQLPATFVTKRRN